MNKFIFTWPFNDFRYYLAHHGIKGQKWGVRNGPPYPIIRPVVPDKVLEGHGNTSRTAEPNSVIDHKNRDGVIDKRVFYDDNGEMYKEIHTTDHKLPHKHNGPHVHDYTWDQNGNRLSRTTRDLTTKEKKENADVLPKKGGRKRNEKT